MKCPTCGAWTRVLRTEGDMRRRECGNLHRFTTCEVVTIDDASTRDLHRRGIAMIPGTSVEVAAKHGVPASTVREWRRKLRQARA